jgi:hypothetical protein
VLRGRGCAEGLEIMVFRGGQAADCKGVDDAMRCDAVETGEIRGLSRRTRRNRERARQGMRRQGGRFSVTTRY